MVLSIVLCPKCGNQVTGCSLSCKVCGAPIKPQPDGPELPSGSRLCHGRYSIVKVLGQGGFGITYLATDGQNSNTQVTIKELFIREKCSRGANSKVVVSQTMKGDMQIFRNRFLKECQNLASLNHHNIVKILDSFDENDTSYFVMEYVNGQSLNMVGALPEIEALRIIWEVCDAMRYVHKKKINHLDIKPGNIIKRSNDGHVFLIDFGVSKNYDPSVDGDKTSTSTVIGMSEGFCPIEQSTHGIKGFSPESDVYAIGATLYCLLTGKRPPNASDILNDGFDDSVLKANEISTGTINAITKAMIPSRKNRIQTVEEFVDMLPKKIIPGPIVDNKSMGWSKWFNAIRDAMHSARKKLNNYCVVAVWYWLLGTICHSAVWNHSWMHCDLGHIYVLIPCIMYVLALIFMFIDFKSYGYSNSAEEKNKLSYHWPMIFMMFGVFLQFWSADFHHYHYYCDHGRWSCVQLDYQICMFQISSVVVPICAFIATMGLYFSFFKLFKKQYVSAVFWMVPFVSCLLAWGLLLMCQGYNQLPLICGILLSVIGFYCCPRKEKNRI